MSSSNGLYHKSEGIAVRGFSYSDDVRNSKKLKYPSVLNDLYYITETGKIYSIVNDDYIAWALRNNLPYVTLTCFDESGLHKEPFYIKDLVAYNYLENSDDYIERGCKVVNIDGDPMNCSRNNVIYLKEEKIENAARGE